MRNKTEKKARNKLFVFDTNVLMHDPTSLIRFKEHDIYIPAVVVEELDNHKKGTTDVARNSRETTRFIELLLQYMEKKYPQWKLEQGLPLEFGKGGSKGLGRLFLQTESDAREAEAPLNAQERMIPDNHIVAAARMLKSKHIDLYSDVVLLSKDMNVRIKARTRGLKTEDYTNDQVSNDSDKGVYTGMSLLPKPIWDSLIQCTPPDGSGDRATYAVNTPRGTPLYLNQLVTGEGVTPSIVIGWDAGKVIVRHSRNYERIAISGIKARNLEQSYLANLLMDEDISLVSILGIAGTGKTLFTIAVALAMKELGICRDIIMTRAPIPVGEDIGFLPGNEEEKMSAWMGALDDNLEVIAEALCEEKDPLKRLQKKLGNGNGAETLDLETIKTQLRKHIKIKSMSFMRGRTFLNKFVIIDEAQNLTPKQMKTLITRAGPGTKIVCLGNLDQIDTPYLTESSSGLAYLIERFKGEKGWPHFGHVTLPKVERSLLAEYAAQVL